MDIKPYAISSLTTDQTATPRVLNHPEADVGSTEVWRDAGPHRRPHVNTDFAQVEADEQQVNLTRFSLFFPEKRDFFLENLGMFSFGGVRSTARRQLGGASRSDAPILFYSRRIGLERGQQVPLTPAAG